MPTGQNYATNVPQTTLTGSVNASATSLSVASSASWPSVPFTAVLDIGTSTQEPVDVTAVVGTTWTVTRNIDGTTGFSHAIGATVTHADIGRDFREARSHIDASTNVHGLTGGAAVVGDIQTQTLTNKTLTSPTINSPTIAGTVAGGASYTAPTLTSPNITGTITGSHTHTERSIVGSLVQSDVTSVNNLVHIGSITTGSGGSTLSFSHGASFTPTGAFAIVNNVNTTANFITCAFQSVNSTTLVLAMYQGAAGAPATGNQSVFYMVFG